jgi:transposase-like protein
VPRPDFPKTIIEFQAHFPDDEACREYLFASRWPEGFHCPRCGGLAATELPRRLLWQCVSCRYQASVTSGTVLHRTRTPLHLWFWAAYLMTTATPGISATQLARQLGIDRHETAWMMLHKLRRAMVNPERTLLTGTVEIDECFVGGEEPGLRGGRARGDKALVVVAVEARGAASGRVRMRVVDDASAQTLHPFVQANVAVGATVRTDGWQGYRGLHKLGYTHDRRSQRAARALGEDPGELLPRVHRVISNLKSWLVGTHHGVSSEHLPVYLDEYVFRFNRRRTPMAAFQTLLGLAGQQPPTTYHEITASGPRSGHQPAESTG